MDEKNRTIRDFDLEDISEEDLKEIIKIYVNEVKDKIFEENAFSEAIGIFCEMRELGIRPDSQIASEMIKKCNTAEEVKKVLSACYSCSLDEDALFYVANFLSSQEFEDYLMNCLEAKNSFKKTTYLYFLKRIRSVKLLVRLFCDYCKQYPRDIESINMMLHTIQSCIETQNDKAEYEFATSYARLYLIADEVISDCMNGISEHDIKELYNKKIDSKGLYDVIQIILSDKHKRKILAKLYPIVMEKNIPISLTKRDALISIIKRKHKKIPKYLNWIFQLPVRDNGNSTHPGDLVNCCDRFIASNKYYSKKIDNILAPEIEELNREISSSLIENEEYFRKIGILSGLQIKHPSKFRTRFFITKLLIKIYNEDNIDGIFDFNISYHLGELEGIQRRQKLIAKMEPAEYTPLLFCWSSNDNKDRIEYLAEKEQRLIRYETNTIKDASKPGYLLTTDISALQKTVGELNPERYQILICLFFGESIIKDEQAHEIRKLFAKFENVTVITMTKRPRSLRELLYTNL